MAFDFLSKLLQGGSISPNMETLLAVVPTLVGAYEQGRGRPIGNVLTVGGGLLGQHAGYRKGLSDADTLKQFVQQTVSNKARTPEAAAEFDRLAPLLGQMDSAQASKLLENVLGTGQSEIGQEYKNLPRPIRMGNFQDTFNPKGALGQQYTDPTTGKTVDPNQQLAQSRGDETLKGMTPTKALAMDYQRDHGGSLDGFGQYIQDVRKNEFASHQRQEEARQLSVAHAIMGMKDENMIPAQLLGPSRDLIGIDPNDKEHFTKVIRLGSVTEMKKMAREGKVGIIRHDDVALVAKMKNVMAGLGALNQAAQAILPKGGSGVLDTALETKLNQYGASILARGGNLEASRLLSSPGLLLQEMNQILSGSTRAMANQEFVRFLGDRSPLAGKTGGYLDSSDVRSIFPTPGVDTQETGRQKLQGDAAIIQSRFNEMQIPMPMDAPGVMDLLGAPAAPADEDKDTY